MIRRTSAHPYHRSGDRSSAPVDVGAIDGTTIIIDGRPDEPAPSMADVIDSEEAT